VTKVIKYRGKYYAKDIMYRLYILIEALRY